MTVSVRLKALARKRPVIESRPLIIPAGIASAEALLSAIVRKNVQEFNEKETEQPLFMYLRKEDLDNQAAAGKVGFDDKKNEKKQDEEEAVRNALEAFSDGLFRMFINQQEVISGQKITICDGDELLFIKMTMLAGRLW